MQFTIVVENLHGKYPRTAPPLLKVGLLQWNQFDTIVSQGEQDAREVLEQAEAQKVQRMGSWFLWFLCSSELQSKANLTGA